MKAPELQSTTIYKCAHCGREQATWPGGPLEQVGQGWTYPIRELAFPEPRLRDHAAPKEAA